MIKLLPVTLKKKKWDYLYAYNIKTLRDIFVYCYNKKEIEENKLYNDMAHNLISPPGKPWVNRLVKRPERLRLEYIHAAEYLKLIKRTKKVITPNIDDFSVEKKEIIYAYSKNKDRRSDSPFTETEKWALANIIFSYDRATDYLFWFMDFDKYKRADFKINDFKEYAKPIYLSGKSIADKKGTDALKKESDGKIWGIPDKYIRLSNSLFPSWFIELGLIDKITVFPEFSFDKNLWRMYYPIKISDEKFINSNVGKILEELFLLNTDKKSISLPYLLYTVALKCGCSIKAIKLAIEKLYKEDYEHYYLERTSLSLMKRHLQYEDCYIKVDGFYRSSLILARR